MRKETDMHLKTEDFLKTAAMGTAANLARSARARHLQPELSESLRRTYRLTKKVNLTKAAQLLHRLDLHPDFVIQFRGTEIYYGFRVKDAFSIPINSKTLYPGSELYEED